MSACLAGPPAVLAADNSSSTFFGPHPSLTAGVQALQFKDYESGVRLTLEGLDYASSRRQKAAALSNLCAGYAGTGEYEQALVACNEALRLRPRFWNAYNNRAIAWLALGHLVNARADLEAGLALNPDSRSLEEVRVMLLAREADMNVTMAAATPASP